MDVMRGLGRGEGTPLPGVESLLLRFTPFSEGWSRLSALAELEKKLGYRGWPARTRGGKATRGRG